MTSPDTPASHASYLLRRHGPADAARRVGATARAVQFWASGERAPRPAVAARLRDAAVASGWQGAAVAAADPSETPSPPLDGIPPRPSTTATSTPSTSSSSAPSMKPTDAADALARVQGIADPNEALNATRETLAELRSELARLREDPEASARERAQVATAITGLTRLLARLTGSLEVTKSAILRSGAWTRIERAFATVLARHPEAGAIFREVAQELREVD